MSHFTSIRTRMIDRKYLLAALQDLGLRVEEGFVKIRGYLGRTTHAEIRVLTDNPEIDIGFVSNAGMYEAIADWDQLKQVRQEEFVQRVQQRYAYHAAREQLQAQGFTLASEETVEDGRIHLTLRRMV